MEEAFEHGLGGLVGEAGEEEMAGGAFMEGKDGLAVFAEEHEIGFPVAGPGAVVGFRGSGVNGDAVEEELDGAAAARAESPAAGLVAGQEAVPVILLGGAVVDKAVDGLVADKRVAAGPAQAASDLFGGPTLPQAFPHRGAEGGPSGQLVRSAALAAPVGQGLSPQGIVTSGPGFGLHAVAP